MGLAPVKIALSYSTYVLHSAIFQIVAVFVILTKSNKSELAGNIENCFYKFDVIWHKLVFLKIKSEVSFFHELFKPESVEHIDPGGLMLCAGNNFACIY